MDLPSNPDPSVAGVWGDAAHVEQPTDEHPFGVAEGGRYDRGGLLGLGGMGRVVTARDRRLDRDVALKEALPETGRDGSQQLAREARITAKLEHPGIVAVHDAGTDDDGNPWYTMPVMRGRTLRDVLDDGVPEARVPTLRRVLRACEAIAYAHSRGVVHRDLKPTNILLGEFGETRVADWGLALRDEEPDPSDGQPVGTPGWMSPEQEAGERATSRSDVWSLGAILAAVLADEDLPEARAIVRRATEDLPAARYAHAGELAEDLARYLDGKRVRAHDYTAAQLLSRLILLWRAPLIVATLAALAITVAVVIGFNRTSQQRTRAEANLAQALIQQARVDEANDRRAQAEVLAAEALAIADSPQARGVLIGYAGRPRPQRLAVPGGPLDCDGRWVTPDGLRLCQRDETVEARRPESMELLWSRTLSRLHVIVAEDGSIAVAEDLQIHLIDPATGESLATPKVHYPQHMARSPKGLYVLRRGRNFSLLDLDTGERSNESGCTDTLAGAVFRGEVLTLLCGEGTLIHRRGFATEEAAFLRVEHSGAGLSSLGVLDRARLLIGGVDGGVMVVDAATGAKLNYRKVGNHAITQLATSPDEKVVAVRTEQGEVLLWQVDAHEAEQLPVSGVQGMAWGEGRTLHLAGPRAEKWIIPEPKSRRLISTKAGLSTVRFSADRKSVVAVRGDGFVNTWRPDEDDVQEHKVFDSVVKDARFTPDGTQLVAVASSEWGSRIVDLATGDIFPGGIASPGRRVGVFADRTTLVLPWGSTVNLSVSPEARSEPRTFNGVEFWDLGLSEDLTQFALMGSGPTVHVGTGAAGEIEMAWTAEVPGGLGVAITNDGSVAVGTASGIVLFDPGGTRRRLLQGPVLQAVQPAISPSGRLVAAGDLSGSVWIWDAEANDGAGKLLAEVRGHKGRVSGIGFRSETDLVTGGWDATVRRWDLSAINQDPTPEELSAAWDLRLEELLAVAP